MSRRETELRAEERVARWVRPEVRALAAYHVPPSRGLIKLDAMENPYRWPEPLIREWQAGLAEVAVNRYPDPAARGLQEAFRDLWGFPEGTGILLGNGSDEIIQMLALALGGSGGGILSVEPGFVMYRMIAAFSGLDYHAVPLREDFSLDLPALLQAVERHHPAVVFLACPNNPTGNLFDAEQVRQVIAAAPGLVVVDEAYAPFTDATFLPELGRWPNLLVMRTVSKLGLAGLRLGLLAGPPPWIREIDKVRLPYNINALTQYTAAFALRHQEVFAEQTRRIRADRESLFTALRGIPGVHAYRSAANFLLLRLPGGRAGRIHQRLRDEKGILVKNLDGTHPLLRDCLRVTVGTPEENRVFLSALKELL